ncbi:MAG: hypothetical protein HC836_40075 [Richelia sp. RM2_1_2]|nr:hypothetical protein [Richelia sp. RM2_1_2]
MIQDSKPALSAIAEAYSHLNDADVTHLEQAHTIAKQIEESYSKARL